MAARSVDVRSVDVRSVDVRSVDARSVGARTGLLARALRQLLSLPRFTVRGWAFLLTGVVLFVVMEWLQRREFAFVGLFLVLLPVLGLLSVALYRLPLTIERRFSPELAAAGSIVAVRVIVRNWGRLPGPEASWVDTVPVPLQPASVQPFDRLRAFRTSVTEAPTPRVLGYELEASHRGEHSVGPFTLYLTDPFGLVVRRAAVGGTEQLVVTPSTVALPQGALRLASGSGAAQQSRRLGAGGEHDVISRKYQTGDSMRRVNWSATARFGELMVRQDDQQNDQHAVVLLDTAATSYPGAPSFSPEFEWAVSMAASIGLHLLAEGFHVRLVESAEQHGGGGPSKNQHSGGIQFEPNTTSADDSGAEALLLHTARVHPTQAVDIDYRAVIDRAAMTAGDVPPVFAVIGRISAASLQSLAPAARSASGSVAVIVAPDRRRVPEIPAWAEEIQETLEAAGWIAQVVTSDESPSAVWGSVDGERLVL